MMRLYFYLLLTFLFIGVVPATWAQQDTHFNCGQDEYMRKVFKDHPELEQDYRQLVENSKQVKNDGFTQKTVYVIPIVFHIIHQYGSENISDAQVYDEMEVLNRDYSMQNADIANAVAGFDTIAGDAQIQFKLAAIDPEGNCTNGIEHIYSHLTNQADDYSKLHQWPRSRYLNVWVVKTIGAQGVAGYAFYPTAVDGAMFFADGVIILSNYIGRIGTGSEMHSRALTHEIGHFLSLPHVWGDTNDPGVACGDDGIDDTPVTKGFNFCPSDPNQAKICNENIVENYQNYMDYSYCSIMFTKGQVNQMRNALITESANRNLLITDSIHHMTGIDLPTVPLCAPIADFYAKSDIACVGSSVMFSDASSNAVVDSREWTFQDGTPATATSATANVTFSSPGWKTVTLTVSNASGSNTKTVQKAIYVYGDWADLSGPYSEDFDNNTTSTYFHAENPEVESQGFELRTTGGVDNSACFELKNYKDVSGAIPYSNDYFYRNRLGNSVDYLYSPVYNLKYTTSATLTFDYAYATEAFNYDDATEQLVLYSSTNCGGTWIPRLTLKQEDLITAGNASGTDFVPTNAGQWKTASFAIPGSLQTEHTIFRLGYTASKFSNNLFIDNFNISGTLMTEDAAFAAMNFNVYPNPSNASQGIYVSFNSNNHNVSVELLDMSGKLISKEDIAGSDSEIKHKISGTSELKAGVYMVRISQDGNNLVKKVVIL